MEEKLEHLKKILMEMESVLIAYSGGVDSTFLLKVARDILEDKVIAVTALSPIYPEEEAEEAKKIARNLGVKHLLLETRELEDPDFTSNPPERCYYCKKELFSRLKNLATENKIKWVADGSNQDDTNDFRPGMQAARELGIRSPLKEAKLTKDEIREWSRKMGLPTWRKPSFACLASRFPYGVSINKRDLERINQAERFLKNLGIHQVRVRHHQNIARIEVEVDDLPKLLDKHHRYEIVKKIKELGYTYVTVDLEGYRSGSMNEILNKK